jgi:glycosyltransferase involved in cell wall biosynthesis
MNVLMLGWEFPPFFAGGVGMVCSELAKALSSYPDLKITYAMPYFEKNEKQIYENFKIINANLGEKEKDKLDLVNVPALFYAYDSVESYARRYAKLIKGSDLFGRNKSIKEVYGENLLEEVYLYAQRLAKIFRGEKFDVIHAHDWTTIPAALLLRELIGAPIVLHVHITELDKTGGMGGNEEIFKIEKEGFDKADKIIAISQFIKNRLIYNYGIDERKIEIVHNGRNSDISPKLISKNTNSKEKIILFAGRVTLQKGVEYFIRAAHIALQYNPDLRFIVAGSGDQLPKMIELAANLEIGDRVMFYGFYSREEALKLFSMADVFIMPSVSEPFGIVPLEAVARGTPCIISKQSGISEVLHNCLKVDFWDTEEIAHKIIALAKYPTLHNQIRSRAFKGYDNFHWKKPAEKIVNLYHSLG